jgi:acylphosphatase
MAGRPDGTRIALMAADLVRRHVVITGRVQGVFFRDSVREQAEAHGVAGWARNRNDGAVEAVFEGSPEDVERLIDFCRTGPSRADVDDVEISEEEPEGLSGFSIR